MRYLLRSASLSPLTPRPLAPVGARGSLTALFGQRFFGDEFQALGQHTRTDNFNVPSTPLLSVAMELTTFAVFATYGNSAPSRPGGGREGGGRGGSDREGGVTERGARNAQ